MSGKADERVFVRWVHREDFLGVRALTQVCYGVPIPAFIFHDAIASVDTWMRIAVIRGQVVGMLAYNKIGGMLVCDLCVHPDIRRRGIGTRLMGYVQKRLECGRSAVAEFAVTLPEADSFLRSFGGKCSGVKRRPPEQGGDLFIFQLRKQGGSENAGVQPQG